MPRSTIVIILVIIFSVMLESGCYHSVPQRKIEKELVKNQTQKVKNTYTIYLVPLDRYSRVQGAKLHKKYQTVLIGLARHLVKTIHLSVDKESIGFYFDKRSTSQRNLYLGMDISMTSNYSQSYLASASDIVSENLKKTVEGISLPSRVFKESYIAGIVLGWRWYQSGRRVRLTMWISKADMYSYLENKLSFHELVQRSTITDSRNTIITLPL